MAASTDGNNNGHNNGGNGNGHTNGKPRLKMKLGLKQSVGYPDEGIPDSTVLEIDHVTLQDRTTGALKEQWDTFILRADNKHSDPKYHTWRIASLPKLGVHFCFSAANPKTPEELATLPKREDFSGVVKIQREGLHPVRHYQGTLEVYTLPDGRIYAVKTTDQPAGVQHFECEPRYDVTD